jgi:hypothetical protein
MTSAQHLQAVFQELDYLDDGYQDGVVSHVGLRRIILETPEVETEIGPTLTRTLLAHAEQNLYGRLTFEDFLMMAREVAAYSQGYPASAQQMSHDRIPAGYYGTTPRQTIHNAAVRLAIPVQEREDRVVSSFGFRNTQASKE